MSIEKELIQTFQKLLSAKTLEEVMKTVSSSARKLVAGDEASFTLRDNDFCFYSEFDSEGVSFKGRRLPMTETINGWAMLNKQNVIVSDIANDYRIQQKLLKESSVKSLVVVPIHREDPIGAIAVYWKTYYRPTLEEIESLESLAAATCIAMQRVTLVSNLETKVNELSAAEKVKDNFLMTVSHELRTPLNAIMGWAQILRDGGIGEKELAVGLESIERNSRGQAAIIENLLDCSQMALGKLQLNLRPIDVVSIVEGVLSNLYFEARKKNLIFNFTCPYTSIIVLGDADRLEKIYTSLLINAIKFSDVNKKIQINLRKRDHVAEFQIIDEGVGIAKDFLPHIFERFKQADSSLTRKFGGLGLGLSLVQHLVSAHNGEIIAESEGFGQGSAFTVLIPLATSEQIDQSIVQPEKRNDFGSLNIDSPIHH